MSKRRSQPTALKRRSAFVEPKTILRIYCNGDTEKIYFDDLKDDLRLQSSSVRVISTEYNRLSMVNQVKQKLMDDNFKVDSSHEVWVVFDVDALPDGQQATPNLIERQADDAVKLCNRLKYKPIISNDCFELWFLLHFEYYNTHSHRKILFEKVSEKIPKYSKAKSIYHEHLKIDNRTEAALKNAAKLCATHGEAPLRLSQCKPYTNVYELVLRLMKLGDKSVSCTAQSQTLLGKDEDKT